MLKYTKNAAQFSILSSLTGADYYYLFFITAALAVVWLQGLSSKYVIIYVIIWWKLQLTDLKFIINIVKFSFRKHLFNSPVWCFVTVRGKRNSQSSFKSSNRESSGLRALKFRCGVRGIQLCGVICAVIEISGSAVSPYPIDDYFPIT